jgi:hypothetical protein
MRPQTKQPLTVQEQYLRKHKSHHRQVSFLRFFLLGIFLLLWEVSADLDWIDSFFFSSPHRVILCLGELWTERSLPMHIGITLLETILSFLLVFFVSLLLSTLLWFSRQLSEILEPYLVLLNSLPKSALAGHRDQHHHHCWNLCGSIRIHHQLLHRFSSGRSGKGDSDPHTGWKPQGYLFQSGTAGIHSHPAQYHQSQYRAVPGRCYHRGISRRQTGTGLPDHLRFPGLPAGYGNQFHLTAMCDCHAALSADTVSGTLQQKAPQLTFRRSAGVFVLRSPT